MEEQTQALKHELDAALADLEEASTLGEINQTLVDMLEVLKARKASPAPQVTVQVNPTPITVQVPPATAFDIVVEDVQYDSKNRFIGARMIRIPSKKVG